MKCLLFGGSFDPPHWGHVFALCKAATLSEFDDIVVEPVYQHPYDKQMVDFDHRREMCELAFGWIPKLMVNNCEKILSQSQQRRIYTIDVVEHHLSAVDDGAEFYLLVGQDAANDMTNWHRASELASLVKVVTVGRNDGIMPNLSSSEIRWRLCGGAHDPGRNIPLEKMLPRTVLQYIRDHKLYDVEWTPSTREL